MSFSRIVSVATGLLVSSAFLLAAPSTAAPEPATIAASDPNFHYAAVQPGQGGFSWYPGITSTGQTTNGYSLSFRTLGDAPQVGYVVVHYIINPQSSTSVKSYTMKNGTVDEFDQGPIILYNTDTLAFNFTYLSDALNAQYDTFAYSYSVAKKQVVQTTNIVVPVAGQLVTSDKFSADGLGWQVGIQTYTNLPNQVTVEFIADSYASINWANLHYLIGNDGALSNFLMTQNTTAQPNNQVIYYQEVNNLPTGEPLKFNFTFWDVQDQVAQDTQAFSYISGSTSIDAIDNIAQNVPAQDPTSSGSTPSGSSPSGSTPSGSNPSNSPSGSPSGPSTPASNPCAGDSNCVVAVKHNGAVGMMKSGMGMVAALATVAAAVMAVL